MSILFKSARARSLGLACLVLAGCNSSKRSESLASAPAPASASAPSQPPPPPTLASPTSPTSERAATGGLRAEIVPTATGLFPAGAADTAGKPVKVPWMLRVTNTTDAPIVFRTGGDDEGFEIDVRGDGVARRVTFTPICHEIAIYGRKNVIPAKGFLDIPVAVLQTGMRCHTTSIYLTKPDTYAVDVSLVGHVHASAAMDRGESGDKVKLDAPTITIKAG
jgi:hypothetical protein